MNTTTDFVAMPWVEVAKLQDGGFIVFKLNDYGDRRKPSFACSELPELFEYLAGTLADANSNPPTTLIGE